MKLNESLIIDESNIDDIIGQSKGFIETTDSQLNSIKSIIGERIKRIFAAEEQTQPIIRISQGLVYAADNAPDAKSAIDIYSATLKGTDTMSKSNDPVLPKQMLASAFGQKYANAMDSMRAPAKPAADEYQATDAQRKVWAQAFGTDPAYFESFQPNESAKAMDAMGEGMDMSMEKPWAKRYKDAFERTRSGPDAGIDINKSYQSGLSNVGGERGKGGIGATKSSMDKYRKMYEDAKGIKRGKM